MDMYEDMDKDLCLDCRVNTAANGGGICKECLAETQEVPVNLNQRRYLLIQNQNVDGEASWSLYDTHLGIVIGHEPMMNREVAQNTCDALNYCP